MTFAELIQKIRDYTEVDSTVLTDSILDSMIKDAELRISREVDADYERQYVTSNFKPSNRYLELPNNAVFQGNTSRFSLSVRAVKVFNTNNSPTTTETLVKRDVSFIDEYNSTEATGVPKYYSNWKETYLIVAPTPNSAYKVEIDYVMNPDHLSSTNTTTYLSNNYQDLLFVATMMNAYEFLKGPMDMYKLYSDKYNIAIQSFALEQMGARRRDEYTDGVPRVKIPSPSPNN